LNAIETNGLTHIFPGNHVVLDNINLQVPAGSIYGFLGPNGAGKTTTLRLVLGLLRKQQGSIFLFEKKFEDNRIEILKQIGSLIESPSMYGHLTARENLLLLQKIYQCPLSRIEDVLRIVGLNNTGKKKTSRFSLGMKQRLSIAIALLHDPSLLILDEPTNGLDPNGIIEIRELLRELNKKYNTTIIISSHLLSEIEKLVTHIGIISNGKLLFQGSLKDLHLKQVIPVETYIRTSDSIKALEVIIQEGVAGKIQDDLIIMQITDSVVIARLNKKLVMSGLNVYEIRTIKSDLESIFMDFTKNGSL
jgi:ABC-2 type transport system ATP-binding protein